MKRDALIDACEWVGFGVFPVGVLLVALGLVGLRILVRERDTADDVPNDT